MKNRVLLAYKKESDNDFAVTASRVATNMQDNAFFPDVPAALKIVQEAAVAFRAALADATNQYKTAVKNAKRAELEAAINILADYVNQTANGNRTALLSSGFDINGAKRSNVLKPINSLEVAIDQPNEAITKVKRVRGARIYVHQYTPEPVTNNSNWTTKIVAANIHTFTGLQSKERYMFQVIAIGSKGQEVFSPVVAKVIQ